MNRYKLIIYIAMIMPGVLHRFPWIKRVAIIGGSYENSRLMLEAAQCVCGHRQESGTALA